MTDPAASDPSPDNFGDLPIQPTGSGVADMEIAYEQMRLAEDAAGDGEEPAPTGGEAVPTVEDAAAVDSAAHPS